MTKKQRLKAAAELVFENYSHGFSCCAISATAKRYDVADPLRLEYLSFLGLQDDQFPNMRFVNCKDPSLVRQLALLFFAESL